MNSGSEAKTIIGKLIFTLEQIYEDGTEKRKKKNTVIDVLIATKLSQNTTDKTSYIAFQNLKQDFKSWEEAAKAPLKKITNAIKVCGLANKKASDIKKMLIEIQKEYGSCSLEKLRKSDNKRVYDCLLKYQGIGLKTVSCVLAFAMGRDVFPVDTHVHRVLNRTGAVTTNSPEKTFEEAEKLIPDGKRIFFHTNLIKFGRSICKATNPLCGICPAVDFCKYDNKSFMKCNTGSGISNNFLILENI